MLILVAASGIGTKSLVLMTTGSLVAIYVLGTAAALRLLPRGSAAHRCAAVAFVAVVGLLALTGWYLLWPLAIAACALGYLRMRERGARERAER
jgi:amino acid efflux transporter